MQELYTRYKPGSDRILVLEKHARLCITFESRYPRLNCPYRVNAAILKQGELIGIRSRNDSHVAAGLSDLEALRFQPSPARNILSVTELRCGDLFASKID